MGISNLVEVWEDQSGNGFHAYQGEAGRRPMFDVHGLDGMPSLTFDGNDTLALPSVFPLGNYTKLLLFAVDDLTKNNHILSSASGQSSSSGHSIAFGFGDLARQQHPQSVVLSAVPVQASKRVLLTATYSAATGMGHLYQDGVLVGSGPLEPHADPSLLVGGLGGGGFLTGRISEIQVFDRLLGETERLSVEQQMLDRFPADVLPRVDFFEIPRHGSMVQRDEFGFGSVRVAGFIKDFGVSTVEVDVLRDGATIQTDAAPLQYVGNEAFFLIDTELEAGLFDYELDVWAVVAGQRQRIAYRRNLTCGEVFLINGQSNAVAADFQWEGLGNTLMSNWVRTFGTTNSDPFNLQTDRHWDLAEAELLMSHAGVGQLGLHLGTDLVTQLQVPVTIINGAENGTSILAHQRNDYFPTDPNTIYGRLLIRSQRARAAYQARWMIWYQGEKDSGMADNYTDDFGELYADWLTDYPALEQIYVVQTRAGCGNDLVGDGVREALRTLPSLFPSVNIMSSTAVPGHDGCHFGFLGYDVLAERLDRLIQRDFFGSLDTDQITPPNAIDATWSDLNQTILKITFQDRNQILTVEPGAEVDFLVDDGTPVLSVIATGNILELTLDGPSTATAVSYVGHPLDGPFVINGRGIGALTFEELPITQ